MMAARNRYLIKVILAGGSMFFLFPGWLLAQIVPDTSLGSESSIVTPQLNGNRIDGGAIRHENLFHSFQEFNVNLGQTVFFTNPLNVANIFSRITGTNLSRIEGTLGVLGSANLFLMNPNGIIFGESSRLDVQGSFLGTTANHISFADGTVFSATLPSSSLLTVSVPVGLGFGSQPGTIINSSGAMDNNGNLVGLQVPRGESLGLVGGNLSLEGGYLTAEEGRIELGSVGGNNTVGLTLLNPGFEINYDRVSSLGNISLSQARVSASGAGGGEIQLKGDRIFLDNASQVVAETLGSQDGKGITIEANALSLQNRSLISTSTLGEGRGGDLRVNASAIAVTGNNNLQDILNELFNGNIDQPSQIGNGLLSMSFGEGNAGNLTINTTQLILKDGGPFSTASVAQGFSGNIDVNVSDSITLSGSQIFADSFGNGNAGNVTVNTGKLVATDGGGVFASTLGAGQGGILTINASESVDLIGTTPDGRFKGGLFANAFINATGRAGNIQVNAPRLSIKEGAGVSAATFGDLSGGTISVNTALLEILGTSADGKEQSNLVTFSQGKGAAGDIVINTNRLVVSEGGVVSTSTFNTGSAGRLTIKATESIELRGTSANGQFPSSLQSQASGIAPPSSFLPPSEVGAVGAAGDITVYTGDLIIRDRAMIAVSSTTTGEQSGNLTIDAHRILLENQAAITAEPATGIGGNIQLNSSTIQLRNQSQITTTAGGVGSGGNILMNTDTLVALENSDITADAFQGKGGSIQINAQAIFLSPDSQITASSELGIDGIVAIRRFGIDASNLLTGLAVDFVNAEQVIANSCLAQRNAKSGSFTITGTGGLPANPYSMSSDRYVITNIQPLRGQGEEKSSRQGLPPQQTQQNPIVEAQGIVKTANGRVLLGTISPNALSADELVCDEAFNS